MFLQNLFFKVNWTYKGLRFGPNFLGSCMYKVTEGTAEGYSCIVALPIQLCFWIYSIFNWNISAIFPALNLASTAFSP